MAGDFIFQSQWMAEKKFTCARARTAHVLAYTACVAAALALWNAPLLTSTWFLGAVFVTHWLTDCRRWASGDEWAARPIMVDQALHIISLAVLYRVFFS